MLCSLVLSCYYVCIFFFYLTPTVVRCPSLPTVRPVCALRLSYFLSLSLTISLSLSIYLSIYLSLSLSLSLAVMMRCDMCDDVSVMVGTVATCDWVIFGVKWTH
jgi:hypothetical protein